MNRPRQVLGMLVVLLVSMVVTTPNVAKAQATDRISAGLADARLAFEDALGRIRRDVEAEWSKPFETTKERQKRENDRDMYEKTGELPKEMEKYTQTYAKEFNTLDRAYVKASNAYKENGEKAKATVIDKEAESFNLMYDLVRWTNINIEKDKKTLVAGEPPLLYPTGLEGEYRLDIQAKRKAKTGSLYLSFTLPDGKQLEVPLLLDKNGNARAMLTVRNELVCADLGVERPIDISKASGDAKGISLRAANGDFELRSIRVKPVIKGEPPKLQEVVKQKDGKAQPGFDPYVKGAVWVDTENVRKYKLADRVGSRVTFVFPGGVSPAMWQFEGELKDGQVQFDKATRTVDPATQGPATIKSQTGFARINADGSLTFTYGVVYIADGAEHSGGPSPVESTFKPQRR